MRKRVCRDLLTALLIGFVMNPYNSSAAIGDIDAKTGQGVYNSIDVYRLTQTPALILSTSSVSAGITLDPAVGITIEGNKNLVLGVGSDIVNGSLTIPPSTATTSGSSQGSMFTAYLKDGNSVSAAVEGSVLCSSSPSSSNNYVAVQVCPASDANATVVGVAAAAASTGAVVNVYDSGWVLARTTGTVTASSLLMTSSLSAGFLAATVSSTNNVVGVSFATGNSAGGLTRIKLK